MAAWVAPGLEVLGPLLAFGGRDLVAWRRTGDSGFRLATSSAGPGRRRADRRVST